MQVKSYVERIVICLNEDGTLKGAHQETLHQVLRDDGTPLPGGGTMEPASEVDVSALNTIIDAGVLVSQVSQLQQQITGLEQELTSERSTVANLQQELTSAQETIAELQSQLSK